MIFDGETVRRAESALNDIEQLLQGFPATPPDTVIVVDIREEAVYYYCASWESKRIFWPEDITVSDFTGSGAAIYDKSHLSMSHAICLVEAF